MVTVYNDVISAPTASASTAVNSYIVVVHQVVNSGFRACVAGGYRAAIATVAGVSAIAAGIIIVIRTDNTAAISRTACATAIGRVIAAVSRGTNHINNNCRVIVYDNVIACVRATIAFHHELIEKPCRV